MPTTPVAYIGAIPLDPFGGNKIGANLDGWYGPGYGLGTGDAEARFPTLRPDGPNTRFPADCWMLESECPDLWDDTIGLVRTSQFPWVGLPTPDNLTFVIGNNPPRLNGGGITIVDTVYDPTNGTVSGGEIMRFGGDKPAGAVYDYLWSSGLAD
jgi:hypothetical protein